ncbi:MAG: MoaD/ThiS family protein [Candidatus Aureabacteria bacterium]|nr:MoaD/ThiS family protein [Candidatus Auribacterota bacterium]
MRVILQTVSDLEHHFGTREVEIRFEGRCVSDLLAYLKERYDFTLATQERGMLFVNGRGCVDFSLSLNDGDHVAIVPVLAAG